MLEFTLFLNIVTLIVVGAIKLDSAPWPYPFALTVKIMGTLSSMFLFGIGIFRLLIVNDVEKRDSQGLGNFAFRFLGFVLAFYGLLGVYFCDLFPVVTKALQPVHDYWIYWKFEWLWDFAAKQTSS